MSNGSRLRRDRAAAASRTHHPHAPHQHESADRGLLIPSAVAVTAPHCDCRVPMVLLCCRCCGSMSWECAREATPRGHVRVKVIPPPADTFADLQATAAVPAAPTAATPA